RARGGDLPAENQEDAPESQADARQLLDGQSLSGEQGVCDDGRQERQRREQDCRKTAFDPVVLSPVDEAVVRGEEDEADEDDELPFRPVRGPLRTERQREDRQGRRSDKEPEGRREEWRSSLQPDADREPGRAPDDAEHGERRARTSRGFTAGRSLAAF